MRESAYAFSLAAAINSLWKTGLIQTPRFRLDGAKRGFRFPAWQLDRDGRPYAALPKLHAILGSAWAVYRFLITPHGALDERTGLDALKRGHDDDILAAAESVARGDFR